MQNKKRNITVIIIFLSILVVFIGAYKFYNKTSTIDANKIENLIETPYTVSIVDNTKDDVSLNVIGEISTNDIETLTSKIYSAYRLSSIKNINIDVFKDDKSAKNNKEFYSDGIISKITINYKDKKASIGTFQTVPSITNQGKNNLLNCDSEDKVSIKVKDRIATIDLNTDLSDSAINIINQIKTYVNAFRDLNSNYDFKSVEVHINSTSNDIDYSFNTDFGNTLETIKNIKY